jgi:hypothetical protein
MIDLTANSNGNTVQARAGRLTLWIVMLLVVGAAVWRFIGRSTAIWIRLRQVQNAPAPAPPSPPPRAEASEEAMKAVTALQETLKDLQSSYKQLALKRCSPRSRANPRCYLNRSGPSLVELMAVRATSCFDRSHIADSQKEALGTPERPLGPRRRHIT